MAHIDQNPMVKQSRKYRLQLSLMHLARDQNKQQHRSQERPKLTNQQNRTKVSVFSPAKEDLIDTSKLKNRLKLKFLKQSSVASSMNQSSSKVLVVQPKEPTNPQVYNELIHLDEIKDARASPAHSDSGSSLVLLRALETSGSTFLRQTDFPRPKRSHPQNEPNY